MCAMPSSLPSSCNSTSSSSQSSSSRSSSSHSPCLSRASTPSNKLRSTRRKACRTARRGSHLTLSTSATAGVPAPAPASATATAAAASTMTVISSASTGCAGNSGNQCADAGALASSLRITKAYCVLSNFLCSGAEMRTRVWPRTAAVPVPAPVPALRTSLTAPSPAPSTTPHVAHAAAPAPQRCSIGFSRRTNAIASSTSVFTCVSSAAPELSSAATGPVLHGLHSSAGVRVAAHAPSDAASATRSVLRQGTSSGASSESAATSAVLSLRALTPYGSAASFNATML